MKRGSVWHGVFYSLLMAVLILGSVTYSLFHELWSKNDIDWETCKMSVMARDLLPDVTVANFNLVSFKTNYPLKCSTQTVDIEASELDDMKSLNKKVASVMAGCWGMFGSGNFNAFPSGLFFGDSYCVPCARIHFTPEAVEKMRSEDIEFNIRAALDEKVDNKDFSYYNWLVHSGGRFSAFDLGGSSEFVLERMEDRKDEFSVSGGSGIFDSLRLYVKKGVLMVDVPVSFGDIRAIDFGEGSLGDLFIHNDLIEISRKMVGYLEDNLDSPGDVSEFCEGVEYVDFCVMLERYASEEQDVEIVRDDDWYVYVDKGDSKDMVDAVFRTQEGASSSPDSLKVASVVLPEVYNVDRGDLLIGYGVNVFAKQLEIGSHVPYLFYFQVGQDGVFEEARSSELFHGLVSDSKFCGQWYGVTV